VILEAVFRSEWGALLYRHLGQFQARSRISEAVGVLVTAVCIVLWVPLARGVRGTGCLPALREPWVLASTLGTCVAAWVACIVVWKGVLALLVGPHVPHPDLAMARAGLLLLKACLEVVLPAWVAVAVSSRGRGEAPAGRGRSLVPFVTMGVVGIATPLLLLDLGYPWAALPSLEVHGWLQAGVGGILAALTIAWTMRYVVRSRVAPEPA